MVRGGAFTKGLCFIDSELLLIVRRIVSFWTAENEVIFREHFQMRFDFRRF